MRQGRVSVSDVDLVYGHREVRVESIECVPDENGRCDIKRESCLVAVSLLVGEIGSKDTFDV